MGGERVRARKKNRQLISLSDGVGGGGNGIFGLLMFGGALAAAAFVAAAASFAFNKNKTKDAATHPIPKPQQQLSFDNSEEDDYEIETVHEGLRALLQPSTTPINDGDASASRQGGVDIKNNINDDTCITEEKVDVVTGLISTNEDVITHEIVLSEDSDPESGALLQDGNVEEECIDGQGCSEVQDVEVEPQEIQQAVELETESQGGSGEVVSEIGKEEDFNFKGDGEGGKMDILKGGDKIDTTDAAIVSLSGTAEASSDEKDSNQPSAQGGGDIVSEIDIEDGSLLNSSFCPAHEDFNFKGGKMDIQNREEDTIDTDAHAAIEAMTITHEASSDGQSSAAAHPFQLPTRVIPLLFLPLLFLLLLLIDRMQQFISVIIP